MLTDKREDLRNECRIPLELVCDEKDCLFQGTACNISSSGMCFQSDKSLHYGEPVYVKALDRAAPEDFSVYVAQVRWSSKVLKLPIYKVGIMYTAKGNLMHMDPEPQWPARCELCGKKALQEFHETDDNVLLCQHCFRNVGCFDDGNVKQSILRFLQGNII